MVQQQLLRDTAHARAAVERHQLPPSHLRLCQRRAVGLQPRARAPAQQSATPLARCVRGRGAARGCHPSCLFWPAPRNERRWAKGLCIPPYLKLLPPSACTPGLLLTSMNKAQCPLPCMLPIACECPLFGEHLHRKFALHGGGTAEFCSQHASPAPHPFRRQSIRYSRATASIGSSISLASIIARPARLVSSSCALGIAV